MRRTLLVLAVGALTCAVVGGCNKFTKERYMTIRTGMTKLQVEQILGPPTAKFSDSWTYIHDDDDPYYRATVHFSGNRVTDKAWADKDGIDDNPDGKKPIGPAKIIVD